MSQIHGKDTKIEIKVRHYLFSKGFRYRKNVSELPGRPDIVLPRYKTAIFVNGCFWHRHAGCKNCTTPSTNRDFWLQKFEKTVQNDLRNRKELESNGWNVIILWECEIEGNFEALMEEVIYRLLAPSPEPHQSG